MFFYGGTAHMTAYKFTKAGDGTPGHGTVVLVVKSRPRVDRNGPLQAPAKNQYILSVTPLRPEFPLEMCDWMRDSWLMPVGPAVVATDPHAIGQWYPLSTPLDLHLAYTKEEAARRDTL